MLRSSSLLLALVTTVAVALGGCASLPPMAERSTSYALPANDATPLSRIVAASLPDLAPGMSGVRLLPRGGSRRVVASRAVRSLDAQYFDLADDAIGKSFLVALRNAADRGVRVRLLVDDLSVGRSEDLFLTLSAHPQVEVRFFNPLPVRLGSLGWRTLLSLHELGRINRRMHNKLFIADNTVALLGGRNLGEEYFLLSDVANFIDLDVLVSGLVVRELSAGFDRYWNSPHAYPVEHLSGRSLPPSAAAAAFDALAGPDRRLTDPGFIDPLDQPSIEVELDRGRLSLIAASARALVDNPAKVERRDFEQPGEVASEMLAAIASAKGDLLIATPYFVPGAVGMQALRQAREAGVAVTVITNSLAVTDQPLVHGKYARRRQELLALGVYVDSDALAARTTALLELMKAQQAYEVRRAPDGSLQWVGRDRAGRPEVTRHEPGASWWRRFTSRFISSFIREEML